jgi:hypothetical protein
MKKDFFEKKINRRKFNRVHPSLAQFCSLINLYIIDREYLHLLFNCILTKRLCFQKKPFRLKIRHYDALEDII